MRDFAKILKRLNVAICFFIFILSYILLFTKLFSREGLEDLWLFFSDFSFSSRFPLVLLLVGMMMVNLSIEAKKWQFLMKKVLPVTFFQSLKSTLLGICVGFAFPNRVGDFIGRAFVLPQGYALKGSFVTIVGNIAQLSVTLVMGSIAIVYFLLFHFSAVSSSYNMYIIFALFLLLLILLFFLLLAYFKVSKFLTFLSFFSSQWVVAVEKKLSFLKDISSKDLLKVLLLAVLRYLVFATQLYLAILLFGQKLPLFEGMMLCCLYFLITTVVPTWIISEVSVRISVVLLVFCDFYIKISDVGMNFVMLAVSTTFLWLLNVVFPAVVGSLFVFYLKILRVK